MSPARSRLTYRTLLLASCASFVPYGAQGQRAFAQAARADLAELSVTAEAPATGTMAPAASAGYVGGVTGIGGSLRSVDAASAGVISGAALNSRPITRPGEVLESAVLCSNLTQKR